MTGFTHADTAIAQAAGSVASEAVTLTGAIGVGDLVCAYWNAPTIASDVISDSAGIGTWVYPAAGNNFSRMAYCIATTAAAGGTIITVTGGGTNAHRSLVADRFTVSGGYATFGGVANVAAGGTSGNLGSLSNVPAGALLWGALHSDTASVTYTAGSSNSVSCTIGSQTSNANGSDFSEYILSAAGGTESMTWTCSPGVTGLNGWQAYFTVASFTAVGAAIDQAASSFSLTPHAVGDLIMITIRNVSNNTVTVTGVSSTNVNWQPMSSTLIGSTNADTQVTYAGKVTSTSAATVTISWSGTAPTVRVDGQEFSSITGAWVFVAQGNLDVAGTNTWASLTAHAGDLYFGTAYDTAGAVAGSTTGFTYVVDSHGNGIAYNVNCSAGAQAPVWGDSTMAFGSMILVRAVAAKSGVFTVFGQPASPATITADSAAYTLGMQFSSSQAVGATAVWFYSATGAVSLPGTIALYQVTGAGTGTLVQSQAATWSGAAGSGWVRAAFTSPSVLAVNADYKVCVLNASPGGNWYAGPGHYWDTTGAGANGVTNGILAAPNNAGGDQGQCTFHNTGTLAYPATSFNASNYWIDIEVSTVYVVQKSNVSSAFAGNFGANVAVGNSIVMVATGHQPGSTVTTSAPLYNGAAVSGAAKILSNQTTPGVGGTGNATQDIWLLPNVQSAGTSYSITTNSQTGTFVGIFVYEVAGLGVAPVMDKYATQLGGTTSDQSSGPTPGGIAVGPELVIGTNVQDGTLGSSYPPAGYSSTTLASNNSVSGYQIATVPGGSYTYDCGTGNADWVASVVTIRPTQIQYNTGATVAGTGVTAPQFTIPNTGGINGTGVMVGDVMLLDVSFFTEDSSTPTIAFSGGGSGDSNGWKLVPMTDGSSNPQLSQSGIIYSYVWAYYRVATAADIGATITVTETGSPAGTTWSGVSMAAYTGANTIQPIDRAGSATENNTAQYVVLPTETARIAGDWAVFMAGGGFNNGATAVPPAGSVQRQTSMNSGGTGTGMADSAGTVGLNTVGGGHYYNNGVGSNAYLSGFTILLAPAGIYMVQSASNAASATSVTVTLGGQPTPGDTLVALVGDSADTTSASPSGITLGGSADNWAQLALEGTGGDHAIVTGWADANCAGGSTSVVVTTTGGVGDHLFAWVFEVLGMSSIALDVSSGNSTVGGFVTSWTSGTTGTTAVPSEIAFGISSGSSSGTPGLTGPSSPWINQAQQTLAGSAHQKVAICGYQVLTSTGTLTYSGTSSPSNTNDTLVFSLKAPSGGANVNGSVAAVSVAGPDGTRNVSTPGSLAAVTVAAPTGIPGAGVTGVASSVAVAGLDKAPSVTVTAIGQVLVAAPYGRATGSTKSTLLMSLIP